MGIIKSLIKIIAKGFYLLGEGFSYMTLYPRPYYNSYDDNEEFKKDYEEITSDWERTNKDLEEVINKH